MSQYLLALDQGTTSSRAIVFDRMGTPVAVAQEAFRQIYPRPGWVEHDADEIWQTQRRMAVEAVQSAGLKPEQIAAIGITNQRETVVLWDAETGKAVHPAIVWQCRRTADMCRQLEEAGHKSMIRQRTGLILDAYFSGTKIRWMLDQNPDWRRRAERGELKAGTIGSWLIYNLTGGKVHVTDVSNASRTLLCNIETLDWDPVLLDTLGVPLAMLPTIVPSSGVVGMTAPDLFGGRPIPITGIAGDQQAALFGQGCFQPGQAKNTYGTGCFLLANIGDKPVLTDGGLLTTVAWQIGKTVTYALEGSVFIGGAVIQWLRDEMGLIQQASDSELVAAGVADTGGVYVVPAFVGLGAPYWDMEARGMITGLTRGSNRKHLVRAALESIAYQSRDVLDAMTQGLGKDLAVLRVDGGASQNNLLMQFQADILGLPVERPKTHETTALGAAYLAGLGVGMWQSPADIAGQWQLDRRYEPAMGRERAEALYTGWQAAVERCKTP
ncbi:MAG: glycerol kinase GlpK [Candidatus Sericytochromatia bacterium]|nr:glycerol kinase GlpK [Candidatus Sericytochromatia bacterium]